jgi:hypothetical protein
MSSGLERKLTAFKVDLDGFEMVTYKISPSHWLAFLGSFANI